MSDRLDKMFEQQSQFMTLLKEKRTFPDFPLDLTKKESQKFIKMIAHDAMCELFEAVQELKNSKSHRATEVNEFDKNAYLEELVDTAHYIIEILHLSGITPQEFYDAYMKKGEVNNERILKGY